MSESTSSEELSNVDVRSTDEQPRKYLRRNNDVSIGVTTRSRQREQDKRNKESEPSETMSTNSAASNTLVPVPSLEQCAICMENFSEQEVGIPENCEHSFCLRCILEWAKKNNSCPIDRKVFRRILKKKSYTSTKPYDTMEVKDNRLEVQMEDDFLEMIDDDISCRICGGDEQEDLLLICDECGNGYHTFCLELPGVPNTPEWMCPLCEVDQLSADEALYDDSDLEELHQILFDDTFDTIETDTEPADTPANRRRTRVRQTARMRTGANVRNQRQTPATTRPVRRQRRQRRSPTRRRLTVTEQHRQRHRRTRRVIQNVHRRIENVNTRTRDGAAIADTRGVTIRNDAPRLSIYDSEPVAVEDNLQTANSSSSRTIISPSEAARRIAASGIPILARTQTEPSISRELSVRRTTPLLDRVPSRTIRPPEMPSTRPRVPISQLPRIQRRPGVPARSRPTPPVRALTTNSMPSSAPSVSSSFLDNLLNSQQRLHSLHNVRLHGPHIEI